MNKVYIKIHNPIEYAVFEDEYIIPEDISPHDVCMVELFVFAVHKVDAYLNHEVMMELNMIGISNEEIKERFLEAQNKYIVDEFIITKGETI